jgi:hypothetical protein
VFGSWPWYEAHTSVPSGISIVCHAPLEVDIVGAKEETCTGNARRTSTGGDCGCAPSCPSRLSSSGNPSSRINSHQIPRPRDSLCGAGPATGGVTDGGSGNSGGGGDATSCRGAETGGGGRRKTTSGRARSSRDTDAAVGIYLPTALTRIRGFGGGVG